MAKVQDNLLSMEIVWMPCEEELEELKNTIGSEKDRINSKALLKCKSTVSLQKYLSTTLNFATIEFLDIRLKKASSYEYVDPQDEDFHNATKKPSSLSYSESLYSINCKVGNAKHLLGGKTNVIDLFCSSKRVGGIKRDLWMTFFDPATLRDDLETNSSLKPISATMEFKSFTLGNLVGLNTFVSHFDSTSVLEPHGYKITQVEARFLHDFQQLEVYFVVGKAKLHPKKRSPETHRLLKMEAPYSSINRILICSEKRSTVFLQFLHPPLLFGVVHDPEAETYVSLLNSTPDTNWERILDVFEGSPVELRREFSMNTVLRLELNSLSDYDFLIQMSNHCNQFEMYFSPITVIQASPIAQISAIPSKNFDCYYALKCIVSRSFEVYDHITASGEKKEVNDFLSVKCKERPKLLCEVLFRIYNALEQGNVVIFSTALKTLFKKLDSEGEYCEFIYINQSDPKIFEKADRSKDFRHSKSEVIYIRRAVVMPTHVRFMMLQPMLKSRLLRSCDPEFALRVSVRDVNLNGLSFTVKTAAGANRRELQVKFASDHIKKKMLCGIKIGNRLYQYLGGSTSQLRSHGLWFYARDNKNHVAADIRRTVGDLEEITLVPKYMARMGQSFSQAMGHVTIPQEWTNVKCPENDILGGKKIYVTESENETEDEMTPSDYIKHLNSVFKPEGECDSKESETANEVEVPDKERYNFTDGIGRMSQEIANLVYEKLELHNEAPSAMQIRYAGCKGMLTVDPRMEGKKIVFRRSMKKFDSDSDSLEILKTSFPRLVYLNRPFVSILEQMGVEKDEFLKLQRLEIQQLIKSIFYNSDAENVLKTSSQLSINYTGLLEAGFGLTEDQFFRSLILAIFRREISLLKTKARILVPSDMGRTMFGVVDETSSLKYGEVFVQYTDFVTKDKKNTKIVEGRVLVTKNPCSHPGDVRKFRAVYKKKLAHIRDCIVFPADGPRPHPDEMAGSDLDGDEYSIIWHHDLMFERENHPAMHFAVPSKDDDNPNKKVEVEDELDFFCSYIMNSSVGVIANAWLAWADKHKLGIFSDKCFSIAKKYSMALDFAKTGKSVQLGRGESVYRYPDFMEKLYYKDCYASDKALGYLYRNCKRLELGLQATTTETKFTHDQDLIYESWEKYKDSALDALKYYSHQIRYSLKAYGIDQEGELVSGALMKVSKLYEEHHNFNDLISIVEYEVRKLFQNLNKVFFAEFGGKPALNEFSEEMRQKASAWYVVTYTQGQDKSSKETKYYGLPWAVADVLIDIKKRKPKQTEVEQANISSILIKKSSFMEALIDKSLKNCLEYEVSSEYRMMMLDTASNVLTKWLKLQEDNMVVVDLKFLQGCLMNVFEKIALELLCCSDEYFEYLLEKGEKRKLTSPAYYILETLLHVAQLGTDEKKSDNFDAYQELGLFAWVTLVRLGCSCSTEPLGITETDGGISQGSYIKHNDEVEVIKVPLTGDFHNSEKQAEMLEQFRCDVIHETKLVKAFLQSQTRLKYIEMRAVDEKQKKFSLRLTVKGSRFAIERLKDLVVLPNFFESVVLGKSRFQKTKVSKPNSRNNKEGSSH